MDYDIRMFGRRGLLTVWSIVNVLIYREILIIRNCYQYILFILIISKKKVFCG